MAGHNKWSQIKRKKGVSDARRSKLFTKILKEIAIATKLGGADPDGNPRLRMAILAARQANMPKENIERAIKKGAGADAENYEEVTYEGYAPGGVAIFVECTTDNHNRTVQNVRSYFTKVGGTLGTNGSLQFIFSRKGVFTFQLPASYDEESFTLAIIDAGADDVVLEEGMGTVYCPLEAFGQISHTFQQLQIEPESGELLRVAHSFTQVDDEAFKKVLKLIDLLEDDDDVQRVYHNMELSLSQQDMVD
jgi:YebC/PmpR family DNA-binding regulatory protein